jgi:hypothetical protein
METAYVQAEKVVSPDQTLGLVAVGGAVELIDDLPAPTARDDDCRSTVGYCPQACKDAGRCVAGSVLISFGLSRPGDI